MESYTISNGVVNYNIMKGYDTYYEKWHVTCVPDLVCMDMRI